MKIGNYTFKRRYSIAQIIVDIVSVIALAYIGYIVYVCEQDIEGLSAVNYAKADLSAIDWKPLLIWPAVGVIICAVSVFLILKEKKLPKKYLINENNAVKYCNITDTCVSCVRLIVLLALSELCYIHMSIIMLRNIDFSMQLIFDVLIIIAIIVFTRIRISAISDDEKEKAETANKREIIED